MITIVKNTHDNLPFADLDKKFGTKRCVITRM